MTHYFLYVLGPIQGDIELVDEKVNVENLPPPSVGVEGIPDLTAIYGENILSIDGPISLKNRNFYQKQDCFLCKTKPIFSDYIKKLSFTFDRKFVLSVFIFCITGILIMNV